MKIFKFRSLDDTKLKINKSSLDLTLDILKTNKLWFSKPSDLNDLFELKPFIDCTLNKIAFNSFIRYIKKVHGSNYHLISVLQSKYPEYKDDIKSHKMFIDNIFSERILDFGVCSFSNSWQEPVLWGMYANNGTGIAIEFEIPDTDVNRKFQIVEYRRIRPKIKCYEIFDALVDNKLIDLRKKMMCTKSFFWRGEKEIRCLIGSGDQSIKAAGKVQRIFFGPKIEDKKRDLIIKLFPKIPKLFTKLSEKSYLIEIRE